MTSSEAWTSARSATKLKGGGSVMRFRDSPPKPTLFIPQWHRRQVTKFLWLPMDLNGEIRWLETATYEEEYMYAPVVKQGRVTHYTHEGGEWIPRGWVDKWDSQISNPTGCLRTSSYSGVPQVTEISSPASVSP